MIASARSRRSRREPRRWISSGSSSSAPTFRRGLSDAYGFWNTICTCGRSRLRSRRSACATSSPSSSSAPAVGVSIIVTCRASVDLPQPDSPTTASVRPCTSSNETPSSARTSIVPRRNPSTRDSGARDRAPRADVAGVVIAESDTATARTASPVSYRAVRRAQRSTARTSQRGDSRQPAGPVVRAGHDARDRPQARAAEVVLGQRVEQRLRCTGGAAHRRSPAPAPVSITCPAYMTTTRSAISATTRQIVRDQQQRHAALALQPQQQREHLRLHGDVERGRRLVGDQQARVAGDRHRDHHALRHAARQLVRIGVEARSASAISTCAAARARVARTARLRARGRPCSRSVSSSW